jgi:outer membrane protein
MSKKTFISPLLVALFLFAGLFTANAQKFGQMNSAALLASLPETKVADEQIKAYRADLNNKGEIMASALQIKYEDYYEKAQGGTLTRVQMQEMEAKLNKERDELLAYEQEMQAKLASKREQLYGPILEKVQNAIDAVGEENDFQFIFDTSVMNTIVFAEETTDVMGLVKDKLGISE